MIRLIIPLCLPVNHFTNSQASAQLAVDASPFLAALRLDGTDGTDARRWAPQALSNTAWGAKGELNSVQQGGASQWCLLVYNPINYRYITYKP